MAERVERRLTTILAADIAEYSRLMRADEDATMALLTALPRRLSTALIAEHRGRIANTAGDAVLAEFPSVADGLSCALAIQAGVAGGERGLAVRPADAVPHRRSSGRCDGPRRRSLRRRGQHRCAAAGARRARRDLRFGGGARAWRKPHPRRLHRCRRAAGQEHRRAGACVPRDRGRPARSGGKPPARVRRAAACRCRCPTSPRSRCCRSPI